MSKVTKKVEKKKLGRPKGSPKTGGRTAGTPNKNLFYFRAAMDNAGLSLAEEFKKLLSDDLKAHEKLEILRYLMSFSYPELRSVEAPTVDPMDEDAKEKGDSLMEKLLKGM